MDRQPIDNLTNAFQLLNNNLILVSNTLGNGVDNGIASAINALNEISLEEGIIAQFINLKEAIDSVTAAISGGGESSEGEGSGSGSGSGKGGEEGGSDNSLTGAIEQMGETANEVIGEPDAEGDGTVIGEFGSMETAVNDVRDAIGTESSEGGNGCSGGEGDDTLVGSIEYLGDKTEEEMGESGGDGIIGRFEEFRDVIEDAENHVQGINYGLDEIDGKTVECTIKINIETSGGGLPGILGSGMNLGSAQYDARYLGNAHIEGTALASGNWAVQSDEKRALVGEEGFEIIVRNGKFFTVGNAGAEMTSIKRGDIVFNHKQSVELLKNGHISGRGKAYADGTVGGGKFLGADGHIYRPLQSGDRAYELQKAFEPLVDKILKGEMDIVSNAVFEGQKQMEKWTKEITNNTAINNIVNNNRNAQQSVNNTFNITMPNVTDSTSATTLMNDLQSLAKKSIKLIGKILILEKGITALWNMGAVLF